MCIHFICKYGSVYKRSNADMWKLNGRDIWGIMVLFCFSSIHCRNIFFTATKNSDILHLQVFFSCRYRLLNATGCHLYCLDVWKNENTCIIYNPVISLKGSPSLNLTSIPSLCLSCLTIILFSFFFHWVKHSLFPKINSCWSFKHPEA